MSESIVRPSLPHITSHWRELFHALMPYRIRDVLLVSSAYDAFLLEEDGPLTRRLFASFSDLDLSWAPRITHAPSAADALAQLRRRPFQLVLIATSLEGSDAVELGVQIRAEHANLPLALLVFDEAQLASMAGNQQPSCFDGVFLWSGDTSTMIAIVKLVEDELNAEHDVHVGDVQIIVVVEDGVRAYSTFLTQLYPEMLRQSNSLVAEGVNEWHRLLRRHARPKIALATTYERARFLCERWRDNLMGVITDVSFPHGGREDPEAGLALTAAIRAQSDPPPVLLQSTDGSWRQRAGELGAWFADKGAPDYMHTVRRFLKEELGFGDFYFRTPDGQVYGTARSVLDMAGLIDKVPIESILHHAQRHDFARWLKARSMFQVARHVRRISTTDFVADDDVRTYLREALQEASDYDQAGVVTDLPSDLQTPSNRFVRLGSGSIGGKARSIAFVSAVLVREQLLRRFDDLEIRIPKTVAVGVGEFDAFLASVDITGLTDLDDVALRRRLMEAPLSETLLPPLREACAKLTGPLAVRSSSLREDARFQPFAGVYATYFLPNNHPDPEVRFTEVQRAIKAVYASMFVRDARTYAAAHPRGTEDEKMAVMVQQLVGQRYGDRFYPHLSGVAQSHNFYPVGPQRADEGVTAIALGMGQIVVGGGGGLRFSPAHPGVLPQFSSPTQVLAHTQRQFYALDLSEPLIDMSQDPSQLLCRYELDVAEADGTLALAGSVYCPEDHAIRENLALAGPRLVTFNNILRWHAIPLAEAVQELLGELRKAMGAEVEIEFAVDMCDWGKAPRPAARRRAPRLYVLQARPMAAVDTELLQVDLDALDPAEVVVRTDVALGNGHIADVRDIVYVHRSDLSASECRAAASHILALDQKLGAAGRRYLLIGPGRWGSSDPGLGIPVEWVHICHARVIVERPLRGQHLQASQGTHFFHNVTTARLGYLTVTPEASGSIDDDWLAELPPADGTDLVHHLALDAPLRIYLDGKRGRAAILRPA